MPIPGFYHNKTSLAFTGGTNCVTPGCSLECRNIDYDFDYNAMLSNIGPPPSKFAFEENKFLNIKTKYGRNRNNTVYKVCKNKIKTSPRLSDKSENILGYHTVEEYKYLENVIHKNANHYFSLSFPEKLIADPVSGKNIDYPVYLYIIEQKPEGEFIHLVLVRNQIEFGSKHITLAKYLNCLERVVLAGSMRRDKDNDDVIEFNFDSGSFHLPDISEMNKLKKRAQTFFSKLAEGKGIHFKYVETYYATRNKDDKPFEAPELSDDDLDELCKSGKVFIRDDCEVKNNDGNPNNWHMISKADMEAEIKKQSPKSICSVKSGGRASPIVDEEMSDDEAFGLMYSVVLYNNDGPDRR